MERPSQFSYKTNYTQFVKNPNLSGFEGHVCGYTHVKSNLKVMMENFICQIKQNNKFKNQNMHMSEVENKLASKEYSIAIWTKMLRTMISQVAQNKHHRLSLPESLQDSLNLILRET